MFFAHRVRWAVCVALVVLKQAVGGWVVQDVRLCRRVLDAEVLSSFEFCFDPLSVSHPFLVFYFSFLPTGNFLYLFFFPVDSGC
jgi:hypothetical protein